jgi:FkbM family methyltransferase
MNRIVLLIIVTEFVIRSLRRLLGFGYGAHSIKREFALVNNFLKAYPTLMLDIGGNKGEYSAEILRKFPNINLHIFEPSKKNCDLLSNRFASSANVTISRNAVTERGGTQVLFSDIEGSGLSSLSKRRLEHFGIEMNLSENVESVSIDAYWKEILMSQIIDFVKIDIEGHELFALNGAKESIRYMRIIQFEFGGCNIDTRTYFQDFWYLFKDANFKIYRISPTGAIPIDSYSENLENFETTNYIAVNRIDPLIP